MWNIAIVKGPRGMGDPHGGVGLDLYPPLRHRPHFQLLQRLTT